VLVVRGGSVMPDKDTMTDDAKDQPNRIVVVINGRYTAVRLDDDPDVAQRVFVPQTWAEYGRAMGYAFGKVKDAADPTA
jgi:hypothetical protein